MAKGKLVDKWKTKNWYTVYAPEMFESREIAHLVAGDESSLINRRIQVSLADLIGDMSQVYTILHFRITGVKGKSAYTKFIGHELSKSYLRTLVRRRRNIISEVVDATTKDGVPVRIKLNIFTARKASGRARTATHLALVEETKARAKEMDFSQLEQEIVFGKFPGRLFNRIKKIVPIKRVEVRKTEVAEVFKEVKETKEAKAG
ncbi:MAG: 30S ribosomal protein S3ae [Candidatus Micrarchaeota archaeon]